MLITEREDLPDDFFDGYNEIDTDIVRDIVAGVRQRGDDALREYTEKFDGVRIDNIEMSEDVIMAAYENIDEDTLNTIKSVYRNIKKFAERQMSMYTSFEYENMPGVVTGQRIIPVERVGIYVPGGRYPLVSTVLMCAVPARVAGVDEVIMCSPPSFNGKIHPAIIVAANIAGVDRIYRVGGAQAIAAMAYGTETIKQVDKIVGPGNRYVAAAKRAVFGKVGIDMIAGPTEVMIIADKYACPEWIAVDMLAQAEHDPNAESILVTESKKIAEDVNRILDDEIAHSDDEMPFVSSLMKNGKIILVKNMDDAVYIANRKAPEHLEIHVSEENMFIKEKLRNYGTLFIGNLSAEPLGDYGSGINHTLPTGGSSRYTGGLSVGNFLKIQTTLKVNENGMRYVGRISRAMAEIEGLVYHAKSVEERMKRLR